MFKANKNHGFGAIHIKEVTPNYLQQTILAVFSECVLKARLEKIMTLKKIGFFLVKLDFLLKQILCIPES